MNCDCTYDDEGNPDPCSTCMKATPEWVDEESGGAGGDTGLS